MPLSMLLGLLNVVTYESRSNLGRIIDKNGTICELDFMRPLCFCRWLSECDDRLVHNT
jgi:hypothetical protein